MSPKSLHFLIQNHMSVVWVCVCMHVCIMFIFITGLKISERTQLFIIPTDIKLWGKLFKSIFSKLRSQEIYLFDCRYLEIKNKQNYCKP